MKEMFRNESFRQLFGGQILMHLGKMNMALVTFVFPKFLAKDVSCLFFFQIRDKMKNKIFIENLINSSI